jgi:hypothetical protein
MGRSMILVAVVATTAPISFKTETGKYSEMSDLVQNALAYYGRTKISCRVAVTEWF